MQADNIIDIGFKRHHDELKASWQAKLLERSLRLMPNGIAVPVDQVGACILSVIAHTFDDCMPVLLRVAHPGFHGIGVPFLCSAAKVAKTGQIMADFFTRDGQKATNQVFFGNTRAMEKAFRKIADDARLDDTERAEFFSCVRRWVVCDYRLDPTMDPSDPDAKRLVVH